MINIIDLYSRADDFFIFKSEEKAEEKIKEIQARGKNWAMNVSNGQYVVFEIKKII